MHQFILFSYFDFLQDSSFSAKSDKILQNEIRKIKKLD